MFSDSLSFNLALEEKGEKIMQAYYHPDLTQFKHDRFGMFIHWGIYAMYGTNEWCRVYSRVSEEEYQYMIEHFQPDLFDPAEWARRARAAGMKYVIFTTKHHDGFCMWDTRFTDYKVTNTPYGRDVLRQIVDAFRAEGIRIGLYYSITDWHHPHYKISPNSPQAALPQEEQERLNALRDNRIYNEYVRNQVTELLTGYGEITELWFDISFQQGAESNEAEKLVALVHQLQPEIILNQRHGLKGAHDIVTPENYLRERDCLDENGHPTAWEGCHCFGASWGYNRDELSYLKSPVEFLYILITQTSLNGNTLFNIGPSARGCIDEHEEQCLDLLAKWMRYHSRSIYGCGAAPKDFPEPRDCRYTYNPETNRLYVHIMRWQRMLFLPNMKGRIRYAQTLHDGAFVRIEESTENRTGDPNPRIPEGYAALIFLDQPRGTVIPVVELFLR